MASSSSSLLSFPPTSGWRFRSLLPSSCPTAFINTTSLSNPRTSHSLNLHRSFQGRGNTRRWPWFLRATSAGPPSPVPEPPFGKDPIAGVQAVLSRIQDRVRIFFAVLFWMSLFFWGSAWDGTDSARKNKGPRFRK